MKQELSTGCELSTASLKKREGEKRNPPLTPYREKGKGKEDKPGACSTGLSARAHADAHVRGALLRRHVNAAVEDALVAFCGTRGPAPSDEALWAKFAWRFGFVMLHELTEQAKSEMNMPGRGLMRRNRMSRKVAQTVFLREMKKLEKIFLANKNGGMVNVSDR